MENNTALERKNFWESLKEKLSDSFRLFFVSTKSKGGNIFKFLFLFILYALAVVGIVFGAIHLADKDDKKGLFGSSYTITYKLDTDPSDLNVAEQQTKTAAEKFSNWLLYKGISNNGVSYQVKQENRYINNTINQTAYTGYLFVNFTNIEKFHFENTDEEDKDVDVYPSLVGVNNINNSNIEIWQFHKPANISNASGVKLYSEVLSSKNFDYSSAKVDKRDATDSDNKTLNTNGVEMNLTGTYNLEETGKVLADLGKKAEDSSSNSSGDSSSTSDDNAEKIDLVVFQNLDGLVNKLNYAKYVAINYQESLNNHSISIEEQRKRAIEYNSLKQADADLVTWADAAKYVDSSSTTNFNTTPITKENLVNYYESIAGIDKISFQNSKPSDVNDSLKTVVDKYVLGTITPTNYKTWFPTTASTIDFAKQSSISIQKTSATASTQSDLIYQFKNTAFPVQFVQTPANAKLDNKEFVINGDGWMTSPYIHDSITGMSSYAAILLASGVTLLVIAIIVSVLYRIPGLMGSFAIIASIIFSAGLLSLLNVNFSIGTTTGLFIGILLATICVSFTMERIRRLIKQKNSIFDSIQTALRKSIMTTIDINATTIIMSLALFFLAKGELTDMALALVLIPLLVLGSVMVFFYFPLYLYSGYRFSWRLSLTLSPLNTESKIKIWFDSKKWWFIWLSMLIIVVVAGILLGTVGINNSSFGNGTLVYINGITQEQANQLNNVFNNSWFGQTFLNGNYEISSNKSFTYEQVDTLVKQVLSGSYTLNVSTVSPVVSSKIFLSGIYGMLAGFGFILVYYLVRANVLTIIPIFLINCLTSLISISISYVVQLPVTNFFIYVLIVSGILSNVVACLFISVTKTRFNKRKIFDNDQICTFIKNNIKSLMNTLFISTGSSLIMFAIMAALVSPTTIFLFVNLAIVSVLSMYLSFFMMSHMYYYVIIIRQLYVNKILYDLDNRINNKFSEVDEQLIYSINKFH